MERRQICRIQLAAPVNRTPNESQFRSKIADMDEAPSRSPASEKRSPKSEKHFFRLPTVIDEASACLIVAMELIPVAFGMRD